MNAIIQSIIRQLNFNLRYAEALVEDLADEQMTIVPSAGLVSHPAFTLGHLVTGSAMMAEDLGAAFEVPAGWADLFQRKGPNDQARPDADSSKYPAKDILLAELRHQHNKLIAQLQQTDEIKLAEPVKWRFGNYMPTMLDLVIFMCISHEQMHLGQLAAWRRAMNLPAALGTL